LKLTDHNAEKATVNLLLDKWEAATLTDTLASFMTNDAMVTGTAPKERYTKKEMVDIWNKYYSGKVPEHTYTDERFLKMAMDGNSATAVEEYNMPTMSSVLQARNTLLLTKINGRWMIDFISIAFLPENDDIPKIEKALSE